MITNSPRHATRGAKVSAADLPARSSLFHLLEQADGAFTVQRPNHVRLAFFDGELYGQAFSPKVGCLLLHRVAPARVHFADVHMDAHSGKRLHTLRVRVREVARKPRHRGKELRIR